MSEGVRSRLGDNNQCFFLFWFSLVFFCVEARDFKN